MSYVFMAVHYPAPGKTADIYASMRQQRTSKMAHGTADERPAGDADGDGGVP